MERFKEIIKKNKLEEKADEIAELITTKKDLSPKEFSKKFNITEEESEHLIKKMKEAMNSRERWLNSQ